LLLTYDEGYVTTLLERAKGSALDVIISVDTPLSTITLLSHHAQKIRHLEFPENFWTDILTFSQVNSGPLPLLRTLEIRLSDHHNPHDQPNTLTSPSPPLFSGAINLEEFVFDSMWLGSLNHFAFPNITTFTLSTTLSMDQLNALHLLDFLKASPTLRTVELGIDGGTMPGSFPQGMVVVLPNVETFSLLVVHNRWNVYQPAVHISCPRAKYTSLVHGEGENCMASGLEIFPDALSWKAISCQYTTSPVEAVTLENVDDQLAVTDITTYSLTFQSSDTTVIRLGFRVSFTGVGVEELDFSWADMDLEVSSQAVWTIREHPQLSHVKRLCIKNWVGALQNNYELPMAKAFGELFGSLESLDELVIHGCELQIFLAPFVDLPEFRHFARVFPHVKELTIISEPLMIDKRLFLDAIVELAKSQYEREKPFERVTVYTRGIPEVMAERLREWVSTVECYEPH
jgi:hypothetical protein